ncbi:MAG TPA: alkaline phosphatase family protein [Solirubrobacteraceae bacterium]|nr:alkaline phosphatase family protein [Solirubrobacteraceae bacterium]
MVPDWIEQHGWVAPDHGGACFAALPGTFAQMLVEESLRPPLPAALLAPLEARYERVVFVYFDALNRESADRHAAHPLLARAALNTKITSQFPSTTTVHMTTIHTGLPVGEHGLYEWFIYEPELDRLIAPLPFTFAGENQGPLPSTFGAELLYPPATLYEWLAERGVSSVLGGPRGLATTPTTGALARGADRHVAFSDLGGGLAELAGVISDLPAPAYAFAYIDTVDTLMHKVGPLEPARTGVDAEITRILDAIETELLAGLPAGTLLVISSDHGMTPVSPPSTIYLNESAAVAELVRRGSEPGDHPLAPVGSCRDLFLHAQPGRSDDLIGALSALVGSRAEVRSTAELLDGGIFGEAPTERLTRRLADVVVLPELGEAVYWHTPGRFVQTLWGQHGGLTPQEMEIPLIAIHAG